MNSIEIQKVWESSGLIKNWHYFNRYLKLLGHYQTHSNIKVKDQAEKGEYEWHHMLTSKIFPEFKKEKWNLILLPVGAHYTVHYLLLKSIRHNSCVFAFNQMRRISKRFGKPKCRLYAAVKKEFAILISENNTGRPKPDGYGKFMSDLHRGTNCYRNNDSGEIRRFKVGDQPNNWVPFQTGRVRTAESRAKLGDSIRGRILQYDPNTKDVKSVYKLLSGYINGAPPWFDNHAEKLKDYSWLYHQETGKVLRIDISNGIPDGYKVGRQYENKGFAMINNSNLIRMLDLKEKKYCMVDKSRLPNKQYIKHGSAIDNVWFIRYNHTMYYTYPEFKEMNPEFPKFTGHRNKDMLMFKIPKLHPNQSKIRQDFCGRNYGKTFQDLGVEVVSLKEFVFEENK